MKWSILAIINGSGLDGMLTSTVWLYINPSSSVLKALVWLNAESCEWIYGKWTNINALPTMLDFPYAQSRVNYHLLLKWKNQLSGNLKFRRYKLPFSWSRRPQTRWAWRQIKLPFIFLLLLLLLYCIFHNPSWQMTSKMTRRTHRHSNGLSVKQSDIIVSLCELSHFRHEQYTIGLVTRDGLASTVAGDCSLMCPYTTTLSLIRTFRTMDYLIGGFSMEQRSRRKKHGAHDDGLQTIDHALQKEDCQCAPLNKLSLLMHFAWPILSPHKQSGWSLKLAGRLHTSQGSTLVSRPREEPAHFRTVNFLNTTRKDRVEFITKNPGTTCGTRCGYYTELRDPKWAIDQINVDGATNSPSPETTLWKPAVTNGRETALSISKSVMAAHKVTMADKTMAFTIG